MHISELDLVRYHEGQLSEPQRSEVATHLHSCARCRVHSEILHDAVKSMNGRYVKLMDRSAFGRLWSKILARRAKGRPTEFERAQIRAASGSTISVAAPMVVPAWGPDATVTSTISVVDSDGARIAEIGGEVKWAQEGDVTVIVDVFIRDAEAVAEFEGCMIRAEIISDTGQAVLGPAKLVLQAKTPKPELVAQPRGSVDAVVLENWKEWRRSLVIQV